MIDRKISARISLVICIFFAVVLAAMAANFPMFFKGLYFAYHDPSADTMMQEVSKAVIPAFYCCLPFAAAALFMLIRLLLNILKDDIFILKNVKYLRYISWCCYAVALITAAFGIKYPLLIIITCSMLIIGTLLRVVKNIMQSAVEIREENDLTI